MKEYILFLIFLLPSLKGDENILLNKAVYVSHNLNEANKINDGDKKSCFSSGELNANWAVVDFQSVVTIKKLVVTSKKGKNPISVYIGNDFHPCKIQKQFKNYEFCNIITAENVEFICEKTNQKGQYLLLLKGNFTSLQNSENLKLCEVEAYGIVVSKSMAMKKPIILSTPLSQISINDFKNSKEIRHRVSKVTVPHYSQTFSYLGNCEPLIFDKVTLYTFSITCKTKDGKGRLIAFGKHFFFKDLVEGTKDTQLKKNIIKWLSPNTKNPSIIGKNSIKSLSDLKTKVKKGDILDFNLPYAYKNDVLNEIILMITNGSIAVNIDWTYFAGTSIEAEISYRKIFNIFNINFKESFITWDSGKEIVFDNSDYNENTLTVDAQIHGMVKNHNYLLKNGKRTAELLSSCSNTMIIKSAIRKDLEALISKYDTLLSFICPCKCSPTKHPIDRKLIEILGELLQSQALTNSNYKLPCIDLFPGDFETTPEKKVVSLTFTSITDSTKNPTGYYLEAGSTFKYIIHKSRGEWSISIGCHSDVLDHRRGEWSRYPKLSTQNIELFEKGEIFSPFGGAILLYNKGLNQTITITLFNVIQTPFFNLRSKTPALEWQTQKNYPGLWGQIAGDNLVVCQESKKLQQYNGTYLEHLMRNIWDPLVRMDYSIKGVDWRNTRPEHVVLDIMTSVGYGHSGYPVVVWDDWDTDIFNYSVIIKDGSWGMCHEIGHNMQESLWTFSGTGEVTNNLLCLFNYDKLLHVPRFGSNVNLLRDNQDNIVAHLNGNVTFDSWKSSPWIALGIYAQLANHLGWGFYKNVFEYYRNNIKSLSSDDDKVAMWVNVTCKISKQNLLPIFDFWGIPFEKSIINEVSKMPCFFPNDFFTKMSETRLKFISSKYPNCNSNSLFYEDYDPKNDILEMRPNFIKELKSKTLSDKIVSSENFKYLEDFYKS